MMRFFLLLTSVLFSIQAFAAPVRVSVKDAVSRALRQNGELRAESMVVRQSEADRDRASGEFGLKLDSMLAVGPITGAYGNATIAHEDKDVWGRTFLGNVKLIQPIYTWGRKSDYLSAADRGISVKQAGVRLKESEVSYQVKEAYFGFLYAKSLLDKIQDGKNDLDKVIEKAQKSRKKKDTFQLEIFSNDLVAKQAEVEKYLGLAREGLRLRMGEAEAVLPADDWLQSDDRELKPLDWYLFRARESRPEFSQIHQGIEAKRLLARAEKKALLPVLALGASYEFSDTNVRTPQPGPFAWDPYNKDSVTVGVGLQWTFQWGLAEAKAAKFSAEADELEAKRGFVEDGLLLQVKKAYWEVDEANKRLAAATEAYKTGKRWFTREMAGYAAGLGDTKALVEAYGARASTVKSYLEAIYQHHMAWAALSRATGREIDPIMQ